MERVLAPVPREGATSPLVFEGVYPCGWRDYSTMTATDSRRISPRLAFVTPGARPGLASGIRRLSPSLS